ncbi:hypothetical protein Y1Q_0009888 [Alligator mississippiensis]|uniref:ribonuclease H n=1 Tax=Alligator mississippiensis TaxID=8496 RepID=A0A151MX52_ALLMI|nr:hypothetical protein Y1Q_0009888 [Alligator mississippiensis]
MLEQGVIQPSRSPWRSPLVPVPKPDGSLRLSMDYRHLNEVAIFDAFPMPHVAELVEYIGNAHYITTLDLTKGYWQIPVAKRDQAKTAFGTPWGIYEFVRMSFGLHGAAATFQRLVNWILAPHAKYAAAYIDNIVIFTQTWDQHHRVLQAVLMDLHETRMMANPWKCALAQRQST